MNNRTYKYHREHDKYVREEVFLSKKALEEAYLLKEKYEEDYPLSNPLQLSRLCSMGLMMLGSLSVEELKNVDNWFKHGGY